MQEYGYASKKYHIETILVLTLLEETNQAITTYFVYRKSLKVSKKSLKSKKKTWKTWKNDSCVLKLVGLVKCWFFRYVVAAYIFTSNNIFFPQKFPPTK